ncbi:MAG: DUF2480 family protein [Chitinophagaceae bacterium]|nr:DUF2480 family protein [Chitinophagaceae bacterium]
MSNTIINKVSESGLITLDLATLLPKDAVVGFDLKDYLFMELILKEKDYRTALQEKDWSAYENKIVSIYCSTDAIIPVWAYMLASVYLTPISSAVYFGNINSTKEQILLNNINNLSTEEYADKRMVIKGCGDEEIPESAYVAITHKLLPVAKSIMYGEPCSTVPIYKKKSLKI